ncbi:MAG: hypothetical protein V2J24_23755 [Pseudomonadales bacterium]|jgi:hypothetical protein|nr:hypothetical protein [Pseudomonadales bacterium]
MSAELNDFETRARICLLAGPPMSPCEGGKPGSEPCPSRQICELNQLACPNYYRYVTEGSRSLRGQPAKRSRRWYDLTMTDLEEGL